MTDSVEKNSYTFYMPREESFYFNHLHVIAGAFLLMFSVFGFFVTKLGMEETIYNALVFVLPIYVVSLAFRKRFASEVTVDFAARKIRFVFQDKRGTIEREFQEIQKVNFGFYLTFVMDDARIMVKRPKNKKEIFQLLKPDFKVDQGILPIN
ncbi:MAG: hypothetical protein A2521_13145 [Deltaproteobacteria bacterium RIFOXYD12_FULL_57_12]|nr:MAG: hypothetical protein A2521_13145 [Deltaproteobacteria bacterium RIFOXYD12_FULL_57_12]